MRIGAYQFAVSGSIENNYLTIQKAVLLATEKGVLKGRV